MESTKPTAEAEEKDGTLKLEVAGEWRVTEELPTAGDILSAHSAVREIRVVPGTPLEWDSSLPLFLLELQSWCREHRAALLLDPLPEELRRLFGIIEESEQNAPPPKPTESMEEPPLRPVRRAFGEVKTSAQFVGECVLGTMEVPADPRQVRWKDLFTEMVEAGPKALPIVGLMSFLVGFVFAFESVRQLRRFGAEMYVINALGWSVVRQIGPTLAGVLLAGRTGAAFAAHLGNMKLNGEIDVLRVLGAAPVSFLVLPRLAALFAIAPMLTLYADLFGILGGLVATLWRVQITPVEFWIKLQSIVTLTDLNTGLIKGLIFGMLVAITGTLRGLQSERTSAGVGRATTSAVVTGITAIIAANSVLSPMFDKLAL